VLTSSDILKNARKNERANMTNLTVSLDETVVRRARVRAIQEGTSLSAKIREFLVQYSANAGADESELRRAATARLMESFAQARATAKSSVTGKGQPGTLRDQLYKGNFRAKARKA
jgi:plasmid stability protein